MGYSNYIGVMDKSLYEKIKRMTYKQLCERFPVEDGDYLSGNKITNEVFEIGKYWDSSFLKPHKFNLFTRKATNEMFNSDGEFFGITKEGFQAIVNSIRDKVIKYYTNMRDEKFDYRKIMHGDPIKNHFRDMVQEWETGIYSFEGPSITNSWKYEYVVFELVRIYKSIDWEVQIVTITGR